jgi:hypothetical protein
MKVAEPSMAYRRRWWQALAPDGNAVLHSIHQRIAGHPQQTKCQGSSHRLRYAARRWIAA